jgi:hypothetical protein
MNGNITSRPPGLPLTAHTCCASRFHKRDGVEAQLLENFPHASGAGDSQGLLNVLQTAQRGDDRVAHAQWRGRLQQSTDNVVS